MTFYRIATALFLMFMVVMGVATLIAFTHRSGIAQIDMAKAHLFRIENR